MTDARVSIALADGTADVRLTRQERLNVLDDAQFDAILAAIDRLAATPGLRCVVLSGEGRAFCAGVDLSLLAGGAREHIAPRTRGIAKRLQQAAWGWRALPAPVIPQPSGSGSCPSASYCLSTATGPGADGHSTRR